MEFPTDVNKLDIVRNIVTLANTCVLTTPLTRMPVQINPRGVKEVDIDGSFWFKHNPDFPGHRRSFRNTAVKLYYSNTTLSEYLSIIGEGNIFINNQNQDGFWGSKETTTSFSLFHVMPSAIYYWDKDKSQMVSLLNDETR